MKGYTLAIQRALEELARAKTHLNTAVRARQKQCKHLDLLECDYQRMEYGSSMPPMRACRSCGMSEEGWGCGYVVLKGRAVMTDRNTVYGTRLGLAIWDDHKGPLLRGETTVAKLVDDYFSKKSA